MKRLAALLLVLLLFCGCAADPVSTEPASEAATTAAATEALPLSELSELTEGTVLFYAQEDFETRMGTLLPLETVSSAPEEALLPRTHLYDEMFPGDGALLLRLLDYALANGYQGFSVKEGTVPAPDAKQFRALEFAYWIDGGGILALEKDGCLTVWHSCQRDDEMEKFSLGLAAARELAARIPRGDDWETANWIFTWLAENVTYADRTPYYFKRGHMLYDALVEKDCLCSGYANAMYYLCNLCGVECVNVYGFGRDPDSPSGVDDHLWNYARIYGTWYVFDPTCNTAANMGVNVAFAMSFDTMQALGGNKPTGEYTDSSMLPACETVFDPPAAWNTTPAGALRSWLWFAAYDAMDPSYLLLNAGLMTPETEVTPSDDGMEAVIDIPCAEFSAWADRFMSPEARADFPVCFSEAEDGRLLARKSETDTRSFWLSLTLGSVTDNGDGTRSADLGAASALFTVSQNTDGMYFIDTIELTPKN